MDLATSKVGTNKLTMHFLSVALLAFEFFHLLSQAFKLLQIICLI